jgi:hypothetical protein
MKAIVCGVGSIHVRSFGTEWTDCGCGNARAKWLDPFAGTVVVAARNRERVRLLGLNNAYLIPAFEKGLSWESYRLIHERSVKAPGYIFDASKAACWAVIVEIGRSNDVRWATDEEFLEAFEKE